MPPRAFPPLTGAPSVTAETGPSAPLAVSDPTASRTEVLARFRGDVYGQAPSAGWELSWELLRRHRTVGGALREQWSLAIAAAGTHHCTVMIDRPDVSEPVPAFLGLNFRGNHACSADPEVIDLQHEQQERGGTLRYEGLREPITLPVPRGVESHRWPSEFVTGRGFAMITACYLQCGPDSVDLLSHGLLPLLGHDHRSWGGLSLWAWLLSRLLDSVEGGICPGVDPRRVAVVGHSRLGKAALWAAAQDSRFAAAISNDSGCMGAAASRPIGETPEVLARIRPYWFAPRFTETVLSGAPLPVDQHQLLAAIAPRPLYVASASDDANADPEGELASLVASAPAWGVTPDQLDPALPLPDSTRRWEGVPLGYHLRRGPHEMMPWDWIQWLDFADRWL